jgi:hypothetical protein
MGAPSFLKKIRRAPLSSTLKVPSASCPSLASCLGLIKLWARFFEGSAVTLYWTTENASGK